MNLTFCGHIRSWYAEDTARISKLKPLVHFTDYFPNLLVRHITLNNVSSLLTIHARLTLIY
jgi:hypothetical protein